MVAQRIREMVAAVKKKRELSALSDGVVHAKIARVLEQQPKTLRKLEASESFDKFSRSSEYKELLKIVRKELRDAYGAFDLDVKRERAELLATLKPTGDEATIKRLLGLHQSTKERLPYYKLIYRRIFAVTGEPATVLDLGCGANPYSYGLMGSTPMVVAVDLPSDDLADLQRFFSVREIKGLAYGVDLVKEPSRAAELCEEYDADVAFLFKLLDTLEHQQRHVSKKLMSGLPAKWLVVSFASMSLGGKKHIKKEKRSWFEKFVEKEGWECSTFDVANEAFYIVRKK